MNWHATSTKQWNEQRNQAVKLDSPEVMVIGNDLELVAQST
eukprot:COSAG05_NODE_15571_length_366_cov_0.943820_1_plen_40_part_10